MTSEELLEELDNICSKWETPPEDVYVEPRHIFESPVGEPPTLDSMLFQSKFDQRALGECELISDVTPSVLNHDQILQVSNLIKQNEEALSWFMENTSHTCHLGLNECTLLEKVFSNQNFQKCLESFSKLHPNFPTGIG